VPQVGRYLVQRPNGKSLVTRVVTKDKECSCGFSNCEHIRAVRQYLLDGGEMAKEIEEVKPDEPVAPEQITVCPICSTPVVSAMSRNYPLMWKCPEDSSHYWEWYAGKHSVKAFMLGGRPTGIAAIDEMEDYAGFLDEVEGYVHKT